jgi:hypothetical protein
MYCGRGTAPLCPYDQKTNRFAEVLMAHQQATLEELIKDLSPELKQEVANFIESLQKKQAGKRKRRFAFDWEGALSGLSDQITSVDLQHDILQHWDA